MTCFINCVIHARNYIIHIFKLVCLFGDYDYMHIMSSLYYNIFKINANLTVILQYIQKK